MEHTHTSLSKDEAEVLKREIKGARLVLDTIAHWAERQQYPKEIGDSITDLLGSHCDLLTRIVGTTTDGKNENQAIAEHFQRQIDELEMALAKETAVTDLPARLNILFGAVKDWWETEGFRFVMQQSVTSQGMLKVELGFMLSSFASRYSDTPVSDAENVSRKIEAFQTQGFEFSGDCLLDNENNRNLLEALIHRAFPSATVHFGKGMRRFVNDTEFRAMDSVELLLTDFSDLEQRAIVYNGQ